MPQEYAGEDLIVDGHYYDRGRSGRQQTWPARLGFAVLLKFFFSARALSPAAQTSPAAAGPPGSAGGDTTRAMARVCVGRPAPSNITGPRFAPSWAFAKQRSPI